MPSAASSNAAPPAARTGSRSCTASPAGGGLTEITLDELEGYRGAARVRVGNAAAQQQQLDVYGHLLQLAWRWHQRGHSPDDDYWRFLLDVVNTAADIWRHPDRGIWGIRGEPRHFVHSKAMCWAALDCGIRLAETSLRQAPLERWHAERDKIRRAIERQGYDRDRGIFVQASAPISWTPRSCCCPRSASSPGTTSA